MPISFVTAEQRIAQLAKINILLFGPSGLGKTYQARTLPESSTLFVDIEAGTLALGSWGGRVLKIRDEAKKLGCHPWVLLRALTCLMAGPDPAASPNDPQHVSYAYNAACHADYAANVGLPEWFNAFDTVFIDSITAASRLCFAWAQTQPRAWSQKKQGAKDMLGAYGLLGEEMIYWLTQTQHITGKSIVMAGILESDLDEFKRPIWQPQIEGSKTGREMGGIFDQVITLARFDADAAGAISLNMTGGQHRGFVCHLTNPWGLPAKDRTSCLSLIEPPDLGALMRKVAAGARVDTPTTTLPQPIAA